MKHGPYDRLGDNKLLRGWKIGVYEGGVSVPGVINWPARLSPIKINEVISVNDVYPTVAFLTGVEMDPVVQPDGINIWPFLIWIESNEDRMLIWAQIKLLSCL